MPSEIRLRIKFLDIRKTVDFPNEAKAPRLDGQEMVLEAVSVQATLAWIGEIMSNINIRHDYCQISLLNNGVRIIFAPGIDIELDESRR